MLKMIMFTLLTFTQGIALICTIIVIMSKGFQSLNIFNYFSFFLGNFSIICIMISFGKKIDKYERQIPNGESESSGENESNS